MILSHARVLTNAQVLRTHEGSLEILEQVGILVRNETAKSRFAEHGCDVDFDTEIANDQGVMLNTGISVSSNTNFVAGV